MFTLPSISNIVISTLAFVIAAWYLRRIFDTHDIPRSVARSLTVFVLAYVVSWVAGEVVDWAQVKLYGEQPTSQIEQDLNHLLKENGLNSSGLINP